MRFESCDFKSLRIGAIRSAANCAPRIGTSKTGTRRHRDIKFSEYFQLDGREVAGRQTASVCKKLRGHEVTERQVSIPICHVNLQPMDLWTPPCFLTSQTHPQKRPYRTSRALQGRGSQIALGAWWASRYRGYRTRCLDGGNSALVIGF